MTRQSKARRLAEKFKKGEIPGMEMHFDGDDLFILIDGVRVAKRGHPGTPQAKTWVPVTPGWIVTDMSRNIVEVAYEDLNLQ